MLLWWLKCKKQQDTSKEFERIKAEQREWYLKGGEEWLQSLPPTMQIAAINDLFEGATGVRPEGLFAHGRFFVSTEED